MIVCILCLCFVFCVSCFVFQKQLTEGFSSAWRPLDDYCGHFPKIVTVEGASPSEQSTEDRDNQTLKVFSPVPPEYQALDKYFE